MLLRHLGHETNHRRRQVAAYYQGLGAVREHGLYDETRPYVRNVLAINGASNAACLPHRPVCAAHLA